MNETNLTHGAVPENLVEEARRRVEVAASILSAARKEFDDTMHAMWDVTVGGTHA